MKERTQYRRHRSSDYPHHFSRIYRPSRRIDAYRLVRNIPVTFSMTWDYSTFSLDTHTTPRASTNHPRSRFRTLRSSAASSVLRCRNLHDLVRCSRIWVYICEWEHEIRVCEPQEISSLPNVDFRDRSVVTSRIRYLTDRQSHRSLIEPCTRCVATLWICKSLYMSKNCQK